VSRIFTDITYNFKIVFEVSLLYLRSNFDGGSCTVRNFITCTHPQISLGKSRQMRWAGHMARMGEERKVYKVLVGKPEGKEPLGRPRRR
jgi:hypothetical protein